MDIQEVFSRRRPVISFEFFLPKAPENLSEFIDNLDEFKALKPDFITLTYGAGGSERDRTIKAAGIIKAKTGFETVCHLTGMTHTQKEIEERLLRLKEVGIGQIVALRGDIPREKLFLPGHFPHANDLITFIRKTGGFQIAAAGYPETHSEAKSPESDIFYLTEKVRAGADWVITQIFFDNKDYFNFVNRAKAAGISVPIVPGIMPVTSFSQLKRFSSLCGAKIPKTMSNNLDKIEGDPEAVIQYGIEWASRQALELLAGGAPGLHFFTLNRNHSTAEILRRIRRKSE